MKKLSLFLFLNLIVLLTFAQEGAFPTEPKQAQFHTEDINKFWQVFDQTSPKFSSKVWQEEYIDKGSPGLQGFLKNRIGNGKLLAKTIKKNLEYYQAVRQSTLSVIDQRESFYESFQNLKNVYPKAVFPDVYFVIGRKNTGGTTFSQGLIIGTERFGQASEGFEPDIDIKYLDNVVAHELIHFQQNYVKDFSLLAQCIREGAADFLGELISGGHSNGETYAYGDAHKKELWQEFLSRKDNNNWYNWLYYSRDTSRPRNLGYWMGYQICKAYYDQMEDKKQAIDDILNIKDFQEFLDKSGYQGT